MWSRRAKGTENGDRNSNAGCGVEKDLWSIAIYRSQTNLTLPKFGRRWQLTFLNILFSTTFYVLCKTNCKLRKRSNEIWFLTSKTVFHRKKCIHLKFLPLLSVVSIIETQQSRIERSQFSFHFRVIQFQPVLEIPWNRILWKSAIAKCNFPSNGATIVFRSTNT